MTGIDGDECPGCPDCQSRGIAMNRPTASDIKAARKVLRTDIVDAVLLAQKDAASSDAADMQVAIDRSMWGMEGSFGRAMMETIVSGACMLGPKATKDYYGSTIPGRFDVEPGSKGSPEYALAYWNGDDVMVSQ